MQKGFPAKVIITGTGTGIGKTVASAIVAAAIGADYWKPVQAGTEKTDTEWVSGNTNVKVHPEAYRLQLAASPHLAAKSENKEIDIQKIVDSLPDAERLVIEGAGGLMVPLNEKQFVSEMIQRLGLPVILVSRNVLGSINHSLLTAMVCRQLNIPVLGWIFNDVFMDYENEIVKWTGFPSLASIPFQDTPNAMFINRQAAVLKEKLNDWPW